MGPDPGQSLVALILICNLHLDGADTASARTQTNRRGRDEMFTCCMHFDLAYTYKSVQCKQTCKRRLTIQCLDWRVQYPE